MTINNQNNGLDLGYESDTEKQTRGMIVDFQDILNDISGDETNLKKEEVVEIEFETPAKPLEEAPKGEEVLTDKKETEKTDPLEETVVNPQSEKNKSYINRMVQLGIWQPLELIENEDGTEVSFEEAEVTDEMFEAIVSHQENLKKESLLKGRVEAEGISDFTKKLIEIEKNGGNVADALNVWQTIQNPLQSIDITEEKGQIQVIKMLNQAKGIDDETIDTIIAGYKAKGILDEKAEESKGFLDAAAKQHLEKINQQAIDAEKQRAAKLVEYKKNLKEELKQFEINETFQKKIIDAATKQGEDKTFEINNIYNKKRNDPKEAAELAFFLLNKEEYLKQKTKELVTKEQVKIATKFKFSKGNNTDSLEYHNKKKKDNDDVDIVF